MVCSFETHGKFGLIYVYVDDEGMVTIRISGKKLFYGSVKELATLLKQHAKFMDYIDSVTPRLKPGACKP